VYHGLAPDALLDTYDDERLPVIHQLVSTTERATDLFNSDSHFVHTLLRHVLPQVLKFDAVRKKGAGLVSELSVNYRASPLNGRSDGPLHAGDRVPDTPLDGGARMLDLLDPSRFTVLVAGAATLRLPPGELFVARSVAGPAGVAVVRPDGYLLCAGSPASVQAQLDAWAARWMTVAAR